MPIRYRADHVGSLLRPPELLAARTARTLGRISAEELRSVEDKCIAGVLEKQRAIGLDVLTDGELRRGSWLTGMADAVEGFVADRVMLEWKGPGGGLEGSTAQVAGAKLRKLRHMTEYEWPFLKTLDKGTFKITLPAPSNFMVASYKQGITDQFYPTHADLLKDLVDITRDDVQWLVDQGATYIQFDAPYYSHYLDPQQRERLQAAGLDPDRELDNAVRGDNAAFEGLKRNDVTFALHICRGNSRSRWYSEGGYEAIAEKLFSSLNVDTFFLEYDSDRAGSFEPLRRVPKGKGIVLGLVTTKSPQLESQDELLRRIEEAARCAPIENLALSPQCGFASVAAGNLLSEDDQWRKLELVVTTARKVWGEETAARGGAR
jgi:5-methyltetrahydropteroyltriglutamate--homocysteine methyltransferase